MRSVIDIPAAQRSIGLVEEKRLKFHSFNMAVTEAHIGEACVASSILSMVFLNL